jgi:hypothetical protein
MNKTYRKGAVGAMMDEYERAAEFRGVGRAQPEQLGSTAPNQKTNHYKTHCSCRPENLTLFL